MKSRIMLVVFLLLGYSAYAQQDCKVTLPQLSGTYKGDCKNGLAQGKGIAQGVDHYEGQFFKGMPEGKGKYIWADGSYYEGQWKGGLREGRGKMVYADSVQNGYWKENVYQGVKPKLEYRVTVSRNIPRYTLTKTISNYNGIKIKTLLGGNENTDIENFSIASSSGTEYKNINTYGLQNTTLPTDVTVRYVTWNMLHTVQTEVLFEFTIYEAGAWDVTIYN